MKIKLLYRLYQFIYLHQNTYLKHGDDQPRKTAIGILTLFSFDIFLCVYLILILIFPKNIVFYDMIAIYPLIMYFPFKLYIKKYEGNYAIEELKYNKSNLLVSTLIYWSVIPLMIIFLLLIKIIP